MKKNTIATPHTTGRLYKSSGASSPANLYVRDAIPKDDPYNNKTKTKPSKSKRSSTHTLKQSKHNSPATQTKTFYFFSNQVVVFLLTIPLFIAGGIDILAFSGIGLLFNITFLLLCLFTAFRIDPKDIFYSITFPPIAYALIIGILINAILPHGTSWITKWSSTFFVTFAINAPWIIAGSLLAIIIATTRKRFVLKASKIYETTILPRNIVHKVPQKLS